MSHSTAAAAICALGLCVAACVDDPTMSGSPEPTTTALLTSSPADPAAPSTMLPATVPDTSGLGDGADQAEPYLAGATEIYRRSLPDGNDFVARLSGRSYADLFGFTWTAPTGTADRCLGDHAVFIGVPGVIGDWGSAWVAEPWFEEPTSTHPAAVQAAMMAAQQAGVPDEYVLVRVATDAAELSLVGHDGTELDRAPITNRVAMLRVTTPPGSQPVLWTELEVVIGGADGQGSPPVPLTWSHGLVPPDCDPGEEPRRTLPPAGAQPADPAGAEAAIRARLALLVDQLTPAGEKPADLLDDNTGVQAAVDQVNTGPYRGTATTAAYTIDELVFTAPDEAWFRYTITTDASVFADRFGKAVFNGEVWQITRDTICQDLALAEGICDPPAQPVVLPSDPEWEAAWREWWDRAMQYMPMDGCPPVSQC